MTKRYNNLDAVRFISSIMIVMMHILINGRYAVPGNMLVTAIKRAGSMVNLFFLLSGFSMCCGYYRKILDGSISITEFYKKRYGRIAFFFYLILAAYVVYAVIEGSLSPGTIAQEAFLNSTLMFGFLPVAEMEIASVAWTLGVIFSFYIIFPFFVFLMRDKRHGWIAFAVSIGLSFALQNRFAVDGVAVRTNILYELCFFVLGGLLFLYKDQIGSALKNFRVAGYIMIAAGAAFLFIAPLSKIGMDRTLQYLIGFGMITAGALMPDSKLLSNRVTAFGGKYSFELYLSHMVIYGAVGKIVAKIIPGNGVAAYIAASAVTIVAAYVFAVLANNAHEAYRKAYRTGMTRGNGYEDSSR